MVKNDVSFILSFVILIAKMWIFGFSPRVCPTKLCNLVFSLECLVSNGRRALLEDIRLGGSAIGAGARRSEAMRLGGLELGRHLLDSRKR